MAFEGFMLIIAFLTLLCEKIILERVSLLIMGLQRAFEKKIK